MGNPASRFLIGLRGLWVWVGGETKKHKDIVATADPASGIVMDVQGTSIKTKVGREAK